MTQKYLNLRSEIYSWLDSLERSANANNSLPYSQISLWKVLLADLMSFLLQKQNVAQKNSFKNDYLERGKLFLYGHRLRLKAAARAFKRPTKAGHKKADLLILLREENHLTHSLALLRLLQQRNISFCVLVLRDYMLQAVEKEGFDYIYLPQETFKYSHKRFLMERFKILRCLRREVKTKRGAAIDKLFAEDINKEEQLLQKIATGLRHVLCTDLVLNDVLERIRPKKVLYLNSFIMEAQILSALCKAKKIPTFSLQHGDMQVADPLWAMQNSDYYLLWGQKSKQILLEHRWPCASLTVLGSLYYWQEFHNMQRLSLQKKKSKSLKILVALSGAGHMTNLEQHLQDICLLKDAAQRCEAYTWTVRLHPKDKSRYFIEHGAATFVEEKLGCLILQREKKERMLFMEHMRDYDILITATSLSALEAMLLGKKVIVLKQKARHLPDYSQNKACAVVESSQELFEVLRREIMKSSKVKKEELKAMREVLSYNFANMEQDIPQLYYDALCSKKDVRGLEDLNEDLRDD